MRAGVAHGPACGKHSWNRGVADMTILSRGTRAGPPAHNAKMPRSDETGHWLAAGKTAGKAPRVSGATKVELRGGEESRGEDEGASPARQGRDEHEDEDAHEGRARRTSTKDEHANPHGGATWTTSPRSRRQALALCMSRIGSRTLAKRDAGRAPTLADWGSGPRTRTNDVDEVVDVDATREGHAHGCVHRARPLVNRPCPRLRESSLRVLVNRRVALNRRVRARESCACASFENRARARPGDRATCASSQSCACASRESCACASS